jgi:hypothetical protein
MERSARDGDQAFSKSLVAKARWVLKPNAVAARMIAAKTENGGEVK